MYTQEFKSKCLICNSPLISATEMFCEIQYCPDCGYKHFRWIKGQCCTNPKLSPTKCYVSKQDYFVDPDNYKVFNQCGNCGKKRGTELKKKDHLKAPEFDYELFDTGRRINKDLYSEFERIRDLQKEQENTIYWTNYNEYLKSDKWIKIREIVLKRDNNLCQSCLNADALEVHHTNGAYRYNEPIYSLVSLCSRCHSSITAMDRGEKDFPLINYNFKY